MISDANCCELRGGDTVLDLAHYCGTSILSARPYHPRDRAKAESAEQIVERWINARLRQQQFASVHEVNVAMRLARKAERQSIPETAKSPRQHLRRDRRAGLAAAAAAPLRDGSLPQRQGPHRWPWVKHLFGDAAYDQRTLLDKATNLNFTIEAVRGLLSQDDF